MSSLFEHIKLGQRVYWKEGSDYFSGQVVNNDGTTVAVQVYSEDHFLIRFIARDKILTVRPNGGS